MEFPILNVKQKIRQMTDTFLGYNHNLRIGDGEFYDMKNMTSDLYPVMTPRKKRGVYLDNVKAGGLIAKDKLCYVDGADFVVGEERVAMELNSEPKQLISMGAYVIIMPDKKYINTMDLNDNGSIESYFHADEAHFDICSIEGKIYPATDMTISYTAPEEPEDLQLWLDKSGEKPVLKQYSAASSMWTSLPTYVMITATDIGLDINKEDGVILSEIDGAGCQRLNGNAVILDCNYDHIIVGGMVYYPAGDEAPIMPSGITMERKIPNMDFIIESNNRLWGCRYGTALNGETVNEIYASKLGDFRNWNCYMGLSTDSYAVSCGTDGPFTGAITHMGYPLFFKENFVHKVYGDYPANFQIQTTACRGVQKGCHKSLAIVNETLFYKSRGAVCAYDGSLPVEVSHALGNELYGDAVACSLGNKYYISMMDDGHEWNLFVFDTAKGMWHKEDNLCVDCFCPYMNEVYGIDHETKHIITLLGSGIADSNKVPWMVETGLLGMSMPDMKYISKILIRVSLEAGANLRVKVQYDSIGNWEPVCQMTVTRLRTFAVPIRLRRCDHFRIRIEGDGRGMIYSITKTIEQGSDVS